MRYKHLRYFLISFLLLLSLNGNTFGQLLVNENFNYSVGDLTTVSGGNWVNIGGTLQIQVSSGSLTYSGYASSNLFNKVDIVSTTGSAQDAYTQFTTQTVGTTTYSSFLINITNTTGLAANSSTTGDYFIALLPSTSTSNLNSRLSIRTGTTANTFQIGMRASSSNTSAVWHPTDLTVGTTYLIVISYQVVSGSTNDIASVWINPTTNGSQPAADLTQVAGVDINDVSRFAIRQGSSGTPNASIDGIRISTSWSDIFPSAGTPTLTANPTTLSGFSYVPDSGPSVSQSYDLSGSSLSPASGSITVTGSTNYEVSLNNSTFSGSVNIAYTGGALSSTPVYVRLKAGLVTGVYNGELIENDGGGATANVACNGAVVAPEPTNHVTSFAGVLGNPNYYYNNVSWIDASGVTTPDGYLIKSSDVDFASITDPVDGVPESNSFRVQNVLQGVQAAVFTGFAGTTYYYKIFPYTNSGSNINYKTDGSVPQFSLINATAPSLPLTENFNFTTGSNLTANGYVAHSGAGLLPIQVGAAPLTYSGYLNSGLGKTAILTAPGSASAEDVNRLFSSVTSNSVYASFMVNVTSATTTGDYFFHLGPENSTTSFFAKVYIENDGSDNIAFGVSKNFNSSAIFTPYSYALNTTYLLVVKYTFNTGSTTDDEVKLWINPVLNGTEPAASVTQTDGATDATKLDFFAFRQANNGPGLSIGGVRISTSWVPLPSTNFSTSYTFASGWNMVSFPGIHPNSMLIDTLFRGRDGLASVFKFNGTYSSITTVTPGEGYWLKMSANRSYNWNGTVQSSILYPKLNYATVAPVSGNAGWNLIGVYEYQIDPNAITTVPSGLITNPIYKYNPGIGFAIASVMERSQGYWVYLDAAGQIVLPARSTDSPLVNSKSPVDNSFGRIIVTDSQDRSFTLFTAGKNTANLGKFLMPPAPPAGMLDVRFSSQQLVEDVSSDKSIDISEAIYPIKIRVEGVTITIKDAVSGNIINTLLNDGQELVIQNSSVNKLIVSGSETLPVKYALEQNYPNPFNPSTKISYSLPAASDVTLKIFNSLGEEVATLVNQKQEAGKYELNFNSNGLASGMYLYKIQAGSFTQTKKMILMK